MLGELASPSLLQGECGCVVAGPVLFRVYQILKTTIFKQILNILLIKPVTLFGLNKYSNLNIHFHQM